MIGNIPPAFILIIGALLVPLFRRHRGIQAVYMLFLPLFAFAQLLPYFKVFLPYLNFLPFDPIAHGYYWHWTLFGSYKLSLFRVDKLALVFGAIFHFALFAGMLYSLHEKDDVQFVSALIYAGSAIGAVFSGDWISFFVFWELTAISSVFLIWSRRTKRSYRAGMRYLIIQVASGVLLLGGIIMYYRQTGSLNFGLLTPAKGAHTNVLGLPSIAATYIFFAFGIKAAFPFLHNWLVDAYPEATVSGSVFLSAFTTKLAIFAMARTFAGLSILIWIGAIMAVFTIIYAILENDLRRVLAYSLVGQLGYMLVAIGIGTKLALDGAAAHAFTHILYKSLLFMAMGAVLYRTGTIKASELGGIYKSMPWTTFFGIIGAASMAVPLFGGFVSKSIIFAAVTHQGLLVIWLLLLIGAAGVVYHSGLKVPFAAFFSKDNGQRFQEAPLNMLIAMGLVAALSLFVGLPFGMKYFFQILPHPISYNPFTIAHLISQFQLILFVAIAFIIFKIYRFHPAESSSIILDADWTYRKLLPVSVNFVRRTGGALWNGFISLGYALVQGSLKILKYYTGPDSPLAKTLPTGTIALWAALLLGLYLLFYYVA